MAHWTFHSISADNTADWNKIKKHLIGIRKDHNDKKEKFADFNKLIPMPKALLITSGGDSLSEYRKFGRSDKSEQEYFEGLREIGGDKKALATAKKVFGAGSIKYKNCVNLVKYGYKDWYDWRYANWNTKWDGGKVDIDDKTLHIYFETANGDARPVIEKLAKLANFVWSFSPEEGGTTEYEAKDGVLE